MIAQSAFLNGIRLAYDDVGTGPVIVLLHGFPLNRTMWRPQLGDLVAAGYRVITLDLRGFGESDEPDGPYSMELFSDDLVSLLDHLEIEHAIVAGMSMGGYVLFNLLIRYPDIAIVGELKLRIVHCLIGTPGVSLDEIRVVRSHPQGFAQCHEFLDKHPLWTKEPCADPGGAVASVVRDGDRSIAAIGGEIAAKIHGLSVLSAGIETNPLNYTRFVVLARIDDERAVLLENLAAACARKDSGTPNKASVVFSTPNEPGSLFTALRVLSEGGINLSKLESRPIPGKPWRYQFYVDLSIPESGPDNGLAFISTIEALKKKTEDFRFLGAYRASL